MHLVVVHPRLEARGRHFPRYPRFRSHVNLQILRLLTRGLQGQPSPLQTPHGCPGVQGIFPTSPGQVPHGWPMLPHSMVTSFPIPQGCCMAPVAARFSRLCSDRFATPPSRSPHLVPGPATVPRFPASLDPIPHPVFIPHRYPHPPRDLFVPLARVGAFFSPSYPGITALGFWPTLARCPLVPVLSWAPSLIPWLYPTGSPATLWRGHEGPFRRLLLSVPLLSRSSRSVRAVFFWVLLLSAPRWPSPSPSSLCVSFAVLGPVGFFFSNPPPCMHARHCCTGRLFLRLLSGPVFGSLAPVGLSPWRSPAKPGGRPSFASPPRAPRPGTPPVARTSPFSPCCSSPALCAPRCSSAPQGCIFLAHTRLSASARSSSRYADFDGLPRYPFGGILPFSVSAGLPSNSSLVVGRGGWSGSMRAFGMLSFCG